METSRPKHSGIIRPTLFYASGRALSEVGTAIHAELLEAGAVVIRGSEMADASAFQEFVRELSGRPLMNYAGGTSPRTRFDEGIYNSTEYPADMQLDLHNEMSYLPSFPNHIYFYCEIPPTKRGATTLGDGRQILKALDSSVIEEFAARGGVRYERFLIGDPSSQYSWQAAFETTDKTTAEELCRSLGAEFTWTGDALEVHQVRPATIQHPTTGEQVWFNQAEGFHSTVLGDDVLETMRATGLRPRLNSRFGDGTELDVQMLQHIRDVKNQLSHSHIWQRGDVLIVDNILTMHGRQSFSGARKIVVAMN